MFGKSKPKPKAKVEDDWYPISRENGVSPPIAKRKNVVGNFNHDIQVLTLQTILELTLDKQQQKLSIIL